MSSDGSTWTQGSGHDWQGVASAEGMCHSGTGMHAWVVTVNQGTYHQIGIAQAGWDGTGTTNSGSQYQFAFLYSHSNGWDRHRGAAEPVGTPSVSTWWDGTWDSHSKGSQFTVTLDCAARTFEVKTEQQTLGTMSYPSSWGEVYAAAAGQSSDHVYQLQVSAAPPAPEGVNAFCALDAHQFQHDHLPGLCSVRFSLCPVAYTGLFSNSLNSVKLISLEEFVFQTNQMPSVFGTRTN